MIEPDEGCVDIVDVPLLTNVDSAITIVVIVEIMAFCFFSVNNYLLVIFTFQFVQW